jgi:hypothetical protein
MLLEKYLNSATRMFQTANDSVLEQFGVQTSAVPEKESANNTNTGKKIG